MTDMRYAFEREMLACGYEPFELAIDEETGTFSDPELLGMWVGWKLWWDAAVKFEQSKRASR